MMGEIYLRVIEAHKEKAKIKVACLCEEVMDKLGVCEGDVIEIVGKRTASAVVHELKVKPEPEVREKVIGLTELVRSNAGVNIGDEVLVRVPEVKAAVIVKLAPLRSGITANEEITSFIKKWLLDYPVCEGEVVYVSLLGRPTAFKVLVTKPKGIVKVVNSTQLILLEKTLAEEAYPEALWVILEPLGDVSYTILNELKSVVEKYSSIISKEETLKVLSDELKIKYLGEPIRIGDEALVEIFDKKVHLKVKYVFPKSGCYVTKNTKFIISALYS